MDMPLIPLWMIWLAGVADALKVTCCIIGGVLTVVFLIAAFYQGFQDNELGSVFYLSWKSWILCGLSVLVLIVGLITPNQKTMYAMMIGSQLTQKNIELVGGSIQKSVDYLFEKTERMLLKKPSIPTTDEEMESMLSQYVKQKTVNALKNATGGN